MSKAFVICPVRNSDETTQSKIAAYVDALEKRGYEVYWPPRDTDQNDPVGISICEQNRAGIFEADEVHVWYDPKSQGSVFDFGMAFAFRMLGGKKIVLANPEDVQPTAHKSFQNVLLTLAKAPA